MRGKADFLTGRRGRRLITLAIPIGPGSKTAQSPMRSNLFIHASHLVWIMKKDGESSALSCFICWCYFISIFNCLVPVKLYSPDVRTFLLMDKMQNFSDASEDEDDKVSLFSSYIFFVFLLTTYFHLCWVKQMEWSSWVIHLCLCYVKAFIQFCIPRCSFYLVTIDRICLYFSDRQLISVECVLDLACSYILSANLDNVLFYN